MRSPAPPTTCGTTRSGSTPCPPAPRSRSAPPLRRSSFPCTRSSCPSRLLGAALHVGDGRKVSRAVARDLAAVGLEDQGGTFARRHREIVPLRSRVLVRRHRDTTRIRGLHLRLRAADADARGGPRSRALDVDAN